MIILEIDTKIIKKSHPFRAPRVGNSVIHEDEGRIRLNKVEERGTAMWKMNNQDMAYFKPIPLSDEEAHKLSTFIDLTAVEGCEQPTYSFMHENIPYYFTHVHHVENFLQDVFKIDLNI